MPVSKRSLVAAVLLAMPGVSMADPGAADSGNTAWVLMSTALVLFMTVPGLALFYGGLVRAKNVLSVLMQCFALTSVMSLLWFVCGYSLSFTDGGAANDWIGGFSNVMFASLHKSSLWPAGAASGAIPESVFAAFQMTFAVITPALIVGGFAERVRFSSMLLFSALWLLLVYVPVTHWVWGGGWLQKMGVLDFAGGTVVHITAAVAALVAALFVGKRKGFPNSMMPPHNLTMTVTGAGMLWVGWYGFNAGSALAANSDAGMTLLVTHLSAAGGCLSWMLCEWLRHGKPSVLGIVTGMVAGLGTITPASGYVGPAAAVFIGLLAGVVCFNATMLFKQKWHIDDTLDVFPVHGVGGILGTLLVGVFSSPDLGVFSGFGFGAGNTSIGQQFLVQVIAVVSTFVFSGLVSWGLFALVDRITGLRVSLDEETEGLDIVLHEERGYVL